jgi:23S rRNA (cytosine1962-C5)-methyltransferase
MAADYHILECGWPDYALLDSGSGRKLEQFGSQLLVREEPKAWWRPTLPASDWQRASASLTRSDARWQVRSGEPRSWTMRYRSVVLEARLTDMSKHVGVFPEQAPHWDFLQAWLAGKPRSRVLNLFGYTGAASLAAAAAGAEVTHVDASKPALAWARTNQQLSRLDDRPVRWLLDDAFKFVGREVRRGARYHAILLDPPSFGRGPRGEIWKVEQQIVDLLERLRSLLAEGPALLMLTMYNLEASALMLDALVRDVLGAGTISVGELTLPAKHGGHRLPLSLFARWQRP